MTGSVTPIRGSVVPAGYVNEEAVELLERVLEKFRSGEFQSVAIACHDNHDKAFSAWDTGGEPHILLGAHALLGYRMSRDFIGDATE